MSHPREQKVMNINPAINAKFRLLIKQLKEDLRKSWPIEERNIVEITEPAAVIRKAAEYLRWIGDLDLENTTTDDKRYLLRRVMKVVRIYEKMLQNGLQQILIDNREK